jgi:hypothetical protein
MFCSSHKVVFNANNDATLVLQIAQHESTTLIAYIARCVIDVNARQYTYLEFFQHFFWNTTIKWWAPKWIGFALGRLYFTNPIVGERYYLRLLLTIIRGPTSCNDLRTVHGHIYNTFKETCMAMGLLEDHMGWMLARSFTFANMITTTTLLVTILTFCIPNQLGNLWE